MKQRIIDIDLVVTGQHKAVVLDPASGEYMGKVMHFRTRVKEPGKMLERSRQDAPGRVQLVTMLEAMGMSWYPIGVYLQQRGVSVYRVNGRLTKDLCKVFARHAAVTALTVRSWRTSPSSWSNA